MSIALVQGTRPEILKNYPLVCALRETTTPFVVLHTNQHQEAAMRDVVYRDMGYWPDAVLPARYDIGAAIHWLQSEFRARKVRHVVVNGDTAASLAGAIAALYDDLPISHVEAGLRSGDRRMLEERNRIMVDTVASYLFAYTDYERVVLAAQPEIRGQIFVEGNTTVDLIYAFRHRLIRPRAREYLFLTLHRRELVDDRPRLEGVLRAASQLADTVCPVVFPLHPRTEAAIQRYGLAGGLSSRITLSKPLNVFESLGYQRHARLVLTDSGCVQEEAYILGTPCVTIRENTERHLTIAMGANRLAGLEPEGIIRTVAAALDDPMKTWPPIYGRVGVGRRIVQRLRQFLELDGGSGLSSSLPRHLVTP